MKPIYYTVDLKELLDLQDSETQKNKSIAIEKEEQRLRNREELLKIVLPLVHAKTILHNNKCILANYTTTGRSGLLGISKKNLEEQISHYTNFNFNFSELDTVVKVDLGVKEIKVWLHKPGKHISTHNLPYSMTTIEKDCRYGKGIENELRVLAKYCSRYTDNW
jgi:hypothetical protein